MRNQRDGIPVLTGTAWGMAYGALVSALVAAVHGVAWTFDTSAVYLLSLAYLAVFGSVAAFVAYLTLLRQVGPGPAAYVGVATPIVAMAVSTAFEGYRWTTIGAFGVALALVGNWLALKPSGSRRADGLRS
jgi:drug/metabolite transporter (DMT)-like permease